MRIYKTRLAKTKYHTYIIRSDIEGADVLFDNINVGQISDGIFYYKVKEKEDTGSHIVQLQNGSFPVKEDEYTFSKAIDNYSINADGGTYTFNNENIISTKRTYIYVANTEIKTITIENNECVINAVETYQDFEVNFTPETYDIDNNETTESKSYSIVLTQSESNKTLNIDIIQEAGVLHNYTILSDCEGAQVSIDGTNRGTIIDGQFVYSVWNSKAPASVNASLTGGLPANPSPDYTFNITQSSLSFIEDGETKSLNITSTKTTHTYVNTNGTCQRDNSVTCNAKLNDATSNISYSASESLSWITTSSNNVTASFNSDYNSRSGSITYTQSESGKSVTISVSQEARSLYTYTVNSNCNGGTVYFNNVNKGTISNGKCIFTDEASSGTVRISGGVPSNSSVQTDTEYDYDTDYDSDTESQTVYNLSIQSSLSIAASGGTTYVDCVCNTGTRSRSMSRNRSMTRSRAVYTNYNYSSPSNTTCQGNSSVTINYSSSTSTSYGSWSSWSYGSWSSWSYGSWSSYSYTRRSPNVPHGAGSGTLPSTISVTPTTTTCGSGSTMGYRLQVYAQENESENALSGYQNITHPDNSSYTDSITITQAGAEVEYVFETAGTLGTLAANATNGNSSDSERGGTSFGVRSYKRVGNTYTQLGVSMNSHSHINDWWATNGSTYGYDKGANTGWQLNFSANESDYVSSWNDDSHTHNYTVTMVQKETGKTLNVTVKQRDYVMFLTNAGVDNVTYDDFPYTAGNGNHPMYIVCNNGKGTAKTWTAANPTSWCKLTANSGSNSGQAIYASLTANNSFSSRTCSIEFKAPNGLTGITVDIKQASAPNQFKIKTSSGTQLVAISRSNVTSLPSSSIITYSATTSAKDVSSVYISNTGLGAPFTSYATQSFKIWRVTPLSSGGMSATLLKTVSVAPGGTITI